MATKRLQEFSIVFIHQCQWSRFCIIPSASSRHSLLFFVLFCSFWIDGETTQLFIAPNDVTVDFFVLLFFFFSATSLTTVCGAKGCFRLCCFPASPRTLAARNKQCKQQQPKLAEFWVRKQLWICEQEKTKDVLFLYLMVKKTVAGKKSRFVCWYNKKQ